ncbi:MAG TPA: tetratricopeptide repeat protein [Candidatus Saccharimonadales bacterium]|jgi:tetratricopeptide (TPR) repeat protein|nr:tetratricopeptide repeat protein [Candidatus Saccharimonadales bacterium]
MLKFFIRVVVLAVLFCGGILACAKTPDGMEMTTKSAKARASFVDGLAKMETLHIDEGLQSWRNAAKQDPNFALAHIFLAYFAQDPTEQVRERDKALATRPLAGPEERLIVDWLANASKSKWIPAIQAMNEALVKYKQDRHLAWLAGWWLLLAQDQPGQAIPHFERAIKIDPTFADPWNEVAYCYARTGNFDQAFQHIKRYTELLPNEANPQDSFAEISRMAGRFEEALAHYRASLKIDPTFTVSQLGLGDTYALMGDQVRARAEYAIALQKATKVQAVQWSLQSAATYVREGDWSGADAAFQAAAQSANHEDFANLQAEAYRSMALYQKDPEKALDSLRRAETALHDTHKIPQLLIDQELSLVLRARTEQAIAGGNLERAAMVLQQIENLIGATPDAVVRASYNGAAGDLLVAQGKYADAIGHLEDDIRSPYSMRSLIVAYEKTGATDRAKELSARLLGFNEPLIEQAIIVPAFRKSQSEPKAITTHGHHLGQ